MEQYSHTLIARPKDFVPTAKAMQDFIAALVNRGVIPGPEKISVRTNSKRTREVLDPFTRQMVVRPMKDHRQLSDISEIESALANLQDYEIEVAGCGRPRLPPLEIDFADDYWVSLTCTVSSVLRSTSCVVDEVGSSATLYGEPCGPESTAIGYFTNPHTLETISIPEAGGARFWAAFELGKWLFPAITNRLDLLHPEWRACPRATSRHLLREVWQLLVTVGNNRDHAFG